MSDPLHLNPKSLNRNAQFEHKYKRSTQSMINHFLKYFNVSAWTDTTHSATLLNVQRDFNNNLVVTTTQQQAHNKTPAGFIKFQTIAQFRKIK